MVNLKRTFAAFTLAASVTSVLATCLSVSVFTAPAAVAKSSTQNCTEELINGKTYTVTRISVKSPPEKVWQILTDYDNAPRVFAQMKKCKLMQDHGHTKVVKHTINPSGLCTYEYTVEVKEQAPHSLEWHRISGAFKQVDGYWKLEPLDNGRTTLVTYASYVDGGMFLPQPLVKRQCRIDMPAVLHTLKAQAESSSTVHIAGRPQGSNQ